MEITKKYFATKIHEKFCVKIELNKTPSEAKHSTSVVHFHQSDLKGRSKKVQQNSSSFKILKFSRSFKECGNPGKGFWK